MKLNKFQFAIFLLILGIGVFLRFNNFYENLQYHLDPPLFMREVKDMVDEGKLRLIGPMVASKEIQGRVFFTGPYFYWFLAILSLISNWNVVFITGFFAIFWLATFVLIFFWLKKKFGFWPAFFVFSILTFWNYLLGYSRIIWNTHFTPILGVLILIFLENRFKKKYFYLLAGLAFGLGVSIHYGAILWFIYPLIYIISEVKYKKFKIINWLIFLLGIFIIQIPYLIFELKHDFYNIKTVIFHLTYFSGEQTYTTGFIHQYYYYLFPLLPALCLFYGKFLVFIKSKWGNSVLFISQFLLIIFLLYQSLLNKRIEVLINPNEWDIKTQQKIVEIIISDKEKDFEVAALVGPETRAQELRWWLRLKNIKPMSVTDYDKASILYIAVPTFRDIEKETVWEVQSIRPFKIEFKKQVNNNLYLYKLKKEKVLQ